jgi:hypothetical protein
VSCGEAAKRSNGGAYDIVCCARVGLILPLAEFGSSSLISISVKDKSGLGGTNLSRLLQLVRR